MGMDSLRRHFGPANVVGLLRQQSEDFEMNIKHKTTPIEHWIVDGKAYRLATENDVGKGVYRTDAVNGLEHCIKPGTVPLTAYESGHEKPYVCVCRWKYAYVQDDSLLTPQRTPLPALGDGWFLLTAEDGEFKEGDKITSDSTLALGWLRLSKHPGYSIADWLERPSYAARYFGPAKDPATTLSTKPIDWTKPVRTKDGRAVRVLCTDGPGDYPVVGFVGHNTAPEQWTLDGEWIKDDIHENDLENVPQRIQREYWVNVYDGVETLFWYDTKKEADENGGQRFACVKITIDCEEGEGL